ncbi:MAG: low-specificity L-threonine aldolase, partial [Myxococcaceae bacterium]
DTVTRPTAAMREAMATAEVGDDVFGDDPTVNRLQQAAAERLGFEAALFFASGTQCNLAALMAHCGRGDEVLVGQDAHTYCHEGGGAAVLGSIQPQPLEHEPDGTIALERIARAVKPRDDHFARTRLLALEDTLNGKALPLSYLAEATALARRHGLATHLDGARLFNAAVKSGVHAREITRHFDSVSVCLSKGLGAPVGSVLLGPCGFLEEAHRWRKVLGGGMRQAGILAAAGLYALEHHVARLAEDHENAQHLAKGLEGLPGLKVEPPQTNMVWVHVEAPLAQTLVARLKERGVLATGSALVRFVTHLDVSRADIDRAVSVTREIARPGRA